jgi:hypothetical protein
MNHHNMNSANATKEHQQLSEPRESTCEAALKRLEMLRGKIITGDILASLDEKWTGDVGNL